VTGKYLRQLASESLVYGVSGILARFVSVLLVPIYTRIFSPKDYGVITLVTTTLALVSIFVVLGLDNSAHRWYWDTEDTADRKSTLASWVWCQFAWAALAAAAMFALAGTLAKLILGDPNAGTYFRIAALTLPLTVLNSVVTNWFRMQRQPWATMIFTSSTNLATVLLTIFLVMLLHRGIRGVLEAQVVSGASATVAAALIMRDWIGTRWFRLQRLREMLRFSFPLIPAALSLWVISLSDRYFVNFYTSTSEVGLYSVANSIGALVALGTGAFQQAWGPFAMSIHQQADAKRVYANVLLAYLWTTCVISTALGLLAPEAIRLVATPKYLGASSVVGILALGYVMVGLQYVAAIGPALAKTSWPIGAAAILGGVLNLVCNFVLVPGWGKMGAAVATLVSQAFVAGYLFYRSQRLYPIPYRFPSTVALAGLSLGLLSMQRLFQLQHWWAAVGVKLAALALFIPALFLFRILTPAELRRVLIFHERARVSAQQAPAVRETA
jgi:O-antigen/teichoic acid export membrane protein